MNNIINKYFNAYFLTGPHWVGYISQFSPPSMMDSAIDHEGYYKWKPIKGTLTYADYQKVEQKFDVKFPKSFIEWHKRYFFLNAGGYVVSLPNSYPTQPLQAIIDNLDNDLSEELIARKLYPFATDDNDIGFFVFDGREEREENEFPIRLYDHEYGGDDLDGLSEILFSSFTKLLECLTYTIENSKAPLHENIAEFIRIDPQGAGRDGIDFWLHRIAFEKENLDYDE
ncbi:SMI1/KNR4 family protein [Mucilaginibacter lutimaris]|uniref:SMI1/KNR4 family protein n=1 Tax=Mucilaginibacter lutimaris TaxID=931629 RepID=A0ABW2ZEY9_9SPHI